MAFGLMADTPWGRIVENAYESVVSDIRKWRRPRETSRRYYCPVTENGGGSAVSKVKVGVEG
jgi:hypothetical protein